eukprot:m.43234 g.43234  ORF g.43234 m.43234 type:complete len:68 (+) comp10775_c1_seq3:1241-1444(+)
MLASSLTSSTKTQGFAQSQTSEQATGSIISRVTQFHTFTEKEAIGGCFNLADSLAGSATAYCRSLFH